MLLAIIKLLRSSVQRSLIRLSAPLQPRHGYKPQRSTGRNDHRHSPRMPEWLKGDGYKHNIGWVGADDGFLAIDTDGDGRISAANELSFALWTVDPNDIGSEVAANDADGRLMA